MYKGTHQPYENNENTHSRTHISTVTHDAGINTGATLSSFSKKDCFGAVLYGG